MQLSRLYSRRPTTTALPSLVGGARSVGSSRALAERALPVRRGFKSCSVTHGDKLLFTPGPLLTSPTVKAAMQRDLGSRDIAFINLVKDVRKAVLRLAGVPEDQYTMIPIQGSGTFGVEAALTSAVPRDGMVLLIANGAYGARQEKICKAAGIKYKLLLYQDDTAPPLKDVEAALKELGSACTHVSMVHSETTSGIINDIDAVGKLAKKHGKIVLVDAMSSFGAIPIDILASGIDFLITSANKCIQGVPGFAIVIAKRSELEKCKGNSRSLSLDLYEQEKGLTGDGQFRFTPPTHALLAFQQAMTELWAEGGVHGRHKRYLQNHDIVDKGMTAMGFKSYLAPQHRGPIISTYKYPNDPNWSFQTFYSELNNLDLVIYPGKVTNADCFRIGHIGHLFPKDCERLLEAIKVVCKKMNVDPSK